MIKHSETRSSKYSSDKMFDLVADIDNYPDFIPWCSNALVTSRQKKKEDDIEVLMADMSISFKIFRETFSSRVILYPLSKEITVEYIDGPFKFLSNRWIFTSSNDGCIINFNVEFEFKSRMMQSLIGLVFQEAMRRIVHSFEERADRLYKQLS